MEYMYLFYTYIYVYMCKYINARSSLGALHFSRTFAVLALSAPATNTPIHFTIPTTALQGRTTAPQGHTTATQDHPGLRIRTLSLCSGNRDVTPQCHTTGLLATQLLPKATQLLPKATQLLPKAIQLAPKATQLAP